MKKTVTVVLLMSGVVAAQTRPAPRPRAAAAGIIPSYKELKYPPLKPVKIPEVATFTLSNGMKLYLLEDHELPLVRGYALIRTGNLFDPADRVGLATITGTVMRSGGTKDKTGDQLDTQLENIAASVETAIDESFGQASFSCLKENTDEVLGVFHDVLTAPAFRQEKIDLAKTEMRSEISRRNDDPHGIAEREFASIVYGKNTPYGWEIEYATLDPITREDMVRFYQRYYFPENVMLAVLGDFSTAEMKAKLEQRFADWTVKQPPVPPFPAVAAKSAPGVFVAAKSDVTQTFFEVGHLGGELRDKDFPALEVMSDILGGGFHSRLFQRVRTQLGYAYNVYAAWGAHYDHPGLFEISGSTKSESTADTIKVINQEIQKMRTAEVTAEELESAKQTVANSFVFSFDTPAKTLNRVIRYDYFGYPRDFINQYQRGIQAVTREDVLRVAREHVEPAKEVVLAVGNPQEFKTPLATLGLPVTSIDLTIPEPAAAAAAKAPAADAAGIERGKELLQRVQQAVGGADKLAAVRDVVETVNVTMAAMSPGIKITQVNTWLAPDQFRQESQLPFGKVVVYSDGKAGWMATPQGVQPLPAVPLKQVQEELFRNYFTLLLSDRIPERTVSSPEAGVIDITDREGNSARLFVDPKTGLPAKKVYQVSLGMGPPGPMEEIFQEFADVGGIQAPKQILVNQNGKKFAEMTVQECKLNSGIKSEEISKKP
ncbi:MAG TPA: pitrilysin family protein [Bryobacteraceae bacterium]|nr:pitrilysin family protein [Bryobacteraceae bacterium]